jgi:hypothetical protein
LLNEVRHAPNLIRNLIYVRQLASEGCIVTFSDKFWKVTKGVLVVTKGDKVGTLYLCTSDTYSTLATTKIVATKIVIAHVAGIETKL